MHPRPPRDVDPPQLGGGEALQASSVTVQAPACRLSLLNQLCLTMQMTDIISQGNSLKQY